MELETAPLLEAAPASPAPVAPAPAAPSAPAAPAAAAAPSSNGKHARLPDLLKVLMDNTDEDPNKPEDKKPKEEPVKPAAAAAPAAAAPAPEDKPIKARKKAITRPDLPVAAPAAAAPAPVASPAPAAAGPHAEEEREYGGALEDNERQMLKDAEEIEKLLPDKHRGLAEKTKKFLKEHLRLTNDPNFDDESPEYQQWLEKNRPVLTAQDDREINELRVTNRVQSESKKELDTLRHEMYVRDEEPKVKQHGQQVFDELARTVVPQEVLDLIAKEGGGQKGFKKAQEVYALELDTCEKVLKLVREDTEEFRRITTVNPKTGRYLSEIATDPANPKYDQHMRLLNLMADTCEEFKNTGGAGLQKDGKWFVTRQEWFSLPPAQRANYWTFSNDEIMKIAHGKVKGATAAAIKAQIADYEKRGFRRPGAAAAPSPAAPVVPAAPRAAPGAHPSPKPPASAPAADHPFKSLADKLSDS